MKKETTKVLALFFLSIFLISFLIGVVNAAGSLTELTKGALEGTYEIIQKPVETLLGESSGTDIFLGKLLIVIILISIISAILPKAMPSLFSTSNSWLIWIISTAVSLLGVRFLSSEMIYTIILPNEAFAVSLASIIPFILYFYIVEFGAIVIGSFARKAAWIFYAVVFLGLYTLRVDDLGDIAWIYPLTALIALIMAFMDGTIQRIKNKMKGDKAKEDRKAAMIQQVQVQIDDVERASRHGSNAAYIGGSPKGRHLRGMDAYLADLEYYNHNIERIQQS